MSELSFRNASYSSLADCELFARWENDPAIRHLASPQRDENSARVTHTAQSLLEQRGKPSPFTRSLEEFILIDGLPVGHCSVIENPPHRLQREGKVAWIALVIGEKQARGKGIGKLVLAHLEEAGRALGCDHLEAGVFAFNELSLRLFRSQGFEEIGRVKDFTFWNGRRWDDIRFAKKL